MVEGGRIIALAVFVAASVVGQVAVARFIDAGHPPEDHRAQFAPAVLLACGHGFVNPPSIATSIAPATGFEALSSFLKQKQVQSSAATFPPRLRANH